MRDVIKLQELHANQKHFNYVTTVVRHKIPKTTNTKPTGPTQLADK